MDALLEFVNTKEWTPDILQNYFFKHNISYVPIQISLGGAEWRGSELFITTLDEKESFHDICFSLYNIDSHNEKILHKAVELNQWTTFIFPSDDRFVELWSLLSIYRDEFSRFIETAMVGVLNVQYLNHIIAGLSEERCLPIELRTGSDKWSPKVHIGFQPLSLRQWFYCEEIINPLLRGEGVLFSKIVKCEHCEKYFIPKNSKSRFCSTPCRMASNYERRK